MKRRKAHAKHQEILPPVRTVRLWSEVIQNPSVESFKLNCKKHSRKYAVLAQDEPRSGTTSLLPGFLFPKGPLLLVWQILIDLAKSRTGMARGKEGKFSTWVLCIVRAQHGCSYAASVAPRTWHVALAGRSQTGFVLQPAIISAHVLSALSH